MRFVSTNFASEPVGLAEAVNRCVASDGGMFIPQEIPVLPRAFFNNIGEMSLADIAFVVASSFFGQDIPPAELKKIVDETFAADAPLVKVGDRYVLELFHGPTLTFKDYGARFMARVMQWLDRRNPGRRRNVLVATMGNSGAAAANGFAGMDGVDVYVLYPKGGLSRLQRATIFAPGGNIHPVEVLGTIDDCKSLVRTAIEDPALKGLNLTGANSINIARLIPQIVFTFYAYSRLRAMGVADAEKAVYSVPCGNCSNLVAAVMALRTGLPAGGVIAATNLNMPLQTALGNTVAGKLEPSFAPGMDTTHPSGAPRLQALYRNDRERFGREVRIAPPVSDEVIADTIRGLSRDAGYLIDPHGAAAYAASQRADVAPGLPVVVFATGHPAKLQSTMERITGVPIQLPESLARSLGQRHQHVLIPPTLPALKKLLNK